MCVEVEVSRSLRDLCPQALKRRFNKLCGDGDLPLVSIFAIINGISTML